MPLQEEFENHGNFLFKYRSFLPLIIVVIGICIHLRTEVYPSASFYKMTPYEPHIELLALSVGLLGLFIRGYTVGYSAKNTSGRNTKLGQVADSLNTIGIYSIVRHPLYVGNFLMWLAPAILTGHVWFILLFCAVYWIYYERIMYAEEQFLRRKFGEQYINWARQTPAFIPVLSQFQANKQTFNWKKVIKKEKNGLLALIVLFTIFDVSGKLIVGNYDFNVRLLTATSTIGAIYLVLKYLKRNTMLLND